MDPVRYASLMVALLAACDIPTDLPVWDTLWVVPVNSAIIPVAELLPSDVAEASGEEFYVEVPSSVFSRTLGEMCAPCEAVPEGVPVPKPEFTATMSDPLRLRSELVTAELTRGELHLSLHHTFGFDPLRPGGSERGYLILTVSSRGAELARDSLDGGTIAFPPGTVLSRDLSLNSGAVSDSITVGLTLYSPEGAPTSINTSTALTIESEADDVRVSELRLRFDSRTVSSGIVELDFEDVEKGVVNRLQAGAVRVEVGNPFDVSGPVRLRIASPGTVIVKSLELVPGASTARVPFSAEELRSILGQPEVRLQVQGTLATPEIGTDLNPGGEIVYRAQLEATLRTGEE